MTHDLRIEARFRNNVLWHAIHDIYPTVAAFCRAHTLPQAEVGKMLNLKATPWSPTRGVWSWVARRLATVTGLGLEELFPLDLYQNPAFRLRPVAEVPSVQFVALQSQEVRQLAAPAPDEDTAELHGAVEAALATLTPREAEIVKRRFGWGGGPPETYDELAAREGRSRERVRQIEAKAFRKLRHPSRSRPLQPFIHTRRDPEWERRRAAVRRQERAEAADKNPAALVCDICGNVTEVVRSVVNGKPVVRHTGGGIWRSGFPVPEQARVDPTRDACIACPDCQQAPNWHAYRRWWETHDRRKGGDGGGHESTPE